MKKTCNVLLTIFRHRSNGSGFDVILVLPKCHSKYGMPTQSISHKQRTRTHTLGLPNATGRFYIRYFLAEKMGNLNFISKLGIFSGGKVHRVQELQGENSQIWQLVSDVEGRSANKFLQFSYVKLQPISFVLFSYSWSASLNWSIIAVVISDGFIHDTHTIVGTLSEAVKVHGEWTSEFCWFPGYMWCYVSCANCNVHLGWKYFSRNLTPRSFYGLSGNNIFFDTVSNLQSVDRSVIAADSSEDEW